MSLADRPIYLARYIERMGTGTGDMIKRCRDAGLAEPEFALTDGFVITIRRKTPQVTPQVTQQDKPLPDRLLCGIADALGVATPQVTPQVASQVIGVLNAARKECGASELQAAAALKDRVHFLKRYLDPMLAAGWLERTIPGKPTSSKQKYRLTDKGRVFLEGGGE